MTEDRVSPTPTFSVPDSLERFIANLVGTIASACPACRTMKPKWSSKCLPCSRILRDAKDINTLFSTYVTAPSPSKMASVGVAYIKQQLQQTSFARKILPPTSLPGKKP